MGDFALNGTDQILNPLWAETVALDINMEFEVLDGRQVVDEVMSPVEGGYFYVYSVHLICV